MVHRGAMGFIYRTARCFPLGRSISVLAQVRQQMGLERGVIREEGLFRGDSSPLHFARSLGRLPSLPGGCGARTCGDPARTGPRLTTGRSPLHGLSRPNARPLPLTRAFRELEKIQTFPPQARELPNLG